MPPLAALVLLLPPTLPPQGNLTPTLIAPPDGVAGDRFGEAVALSGDTLVVGAPLHKSGAPARGAVYVFERAGAGQPWTLAAELVVPLVPLSTNKGFGSAVALHDDTLVIGYPNYLSGEGAAYVHERNTGGPGAWGLTQVLTEEDLGGRVGATLAFDGSTLVVGAPLRMSISIPTTAPRLLVYEPAASGEWTLAASLGVFVCSLSEAVALSGPRIVAGAPATPTCGEVAGPVVLFERLSGAWQPTAGSELWSGSPATGRAVAASARWIAVATSELVGGAIEGRVVVRSATIHSDWQVFNDPSRDFGSSLALTDERLCVGDPGTSAGVPGRVVRWRRGAGGWGHAGEIGAGSDQRDAFGSALALDGERLAVGAPEATPTGGAAHGLVYVFGR